MKTLLVLEDEPALMTLLRHMLREFTLIEATSAEQAIRLFTQHSRSIDLLVADVTLPQSSGIQVALLLRSEIPDLPVILTSGYPLGDWTGRDYSDLERLGSPSMGLLSKPFQRHELLNMVSELTVAPQSAAASTA